jgi:hypothetical protein
MIYILFLLVFQQFCCARNVYRVKEKNIPVLQVKYTNQNDSEAEILHSNFLRESPTFHTFKYNQFFQNLFPSYVSVNSKIITSEEINQQIENLLVELYKGKKQFTNFTKLKVDFNYFKNYGFLILKFKELPLVLKLFLETPYGLTHPYKKGFQERGMFTMGGSNRYLLGFSRIPNKNNVRKILDKSEKWKDVTMPNKWTWLPKDLKWLQIDGCNIGGKEHQQIKTPATYAIICEEAVADGTKVKNSTTKYLQLCTDLKYFIDPRSINYIIKDEKFIMLDTEHFPTLIGAKRKVNPSHTYSSWYVKIGGIYLKAGFLSSKRERKRMQAKPNLYKL